MKKKIFIIGIVVLVVIAIIILIYNIKAYSIKGDVYEVGYLYDMGMTKEDSRIVISTPEQLEEYLAKYKVGRRQEIMDIYNTTYFKNNSLAIKYAGVNSGSKKVIYKGSIIRGNTIEIKHKIKSPNTVTDDMSGYLIIVEVSKNITEVKRD